jgi:hypothetical protein
VQNNPSAFAESYWSINSLQVFSGSSSAGISGGNGSQPIPSVSAGIPHSSFGGVPTAAPGGQSQSAWGGQPQQSAAPQPQGVPDDKPQWGGRPDGGNGGWGGNGGGFDQPPAAEANAVPVTTAAAGGQFFEVGSQSQAATGLTGASTPVDVNVNAAVPTASAPSTGGSVGTEELGSGVVEDTSVPNTGSVPDSGADDGSGSGGAGNPNVNVNAVPSSDTGSVPGTSNSLPDTGADTGSGSQPEVPQPQNLAPTITAPAQPTKSCNSPWVRHSWSGRYVTVTALADSDFENAKRELAVHDLEARSILEGEEAVRRRGEKVKRAESIKEEEKRAESVREEGRRWVVVPVGHEDRGGGHFSGESEHGRRQVREGERRHVHRHLGKRRGLGWW